MKFTKKPSNSHARVGDDGHIYFTSKPISDDQVSMVKVMVAMGSTEKQIAVALGRSHAGTQDVLKRLGLKTDHKQRMELYRAAKLKARQDRLAAKVSSNA